MDIATCNGPGPSGRRPSPPPPPMGHPIAPAAAREVAGTGIYSRAQLDAVVEAARAGTLPVDAPSGGGRPAPIGPRSARRATFAAVLLARLRRLMDS